MAMKSRKDDLKNWKIKTSQSMEIDTVLDEKKYSIVHKVQKRDSWQTQVHLKWEAECVDTENHIKYVFQC